MFTCTNSFACSLFLIRQGVKSLELQPPAQNRRWEAYTIKVTKWLVAVIRLPYAEWTTCSEHMQGRSLSVMTGSGSQCSRRREGEDGVTCEAGRTCRGVQCAVWPEGCKLVTQGMKTVKCVWKQQAARGIISKYWSSLCRHQRIDWWLVQFYPMWAWFSVHVVLRCWICSGHKLLGVEGVVGLGGAKNVRIFEGETLPSRTKTIQTFQHVRNARISWDVHIFLQAHLVKCHNMNINPKASYRTNPHMNLSNLCICICWWLRT